MPKPCKFLSLDRCQKRFLWKLILLCTRLLVLCSKKKMWRSFLKHLVSKAWILFFRVSKQGPCFTATEEDGGDKRLVEFEFAYKAGGVALPDPV